MLGADLNEIAASGRERLNESFIYCVISTFNNTEPSCKLGVDIPRLIQCDQAYRLVPGPPHSVLQYGAILPLVDFLKGDWKDLPMNYCQTIEQMQEEETTLVASNVIDKIQGLYAGFNQYEKFVALLLYEFYSRRLENLKGYLNTIEPASLKTA